MDPLVDQELALDLVPEELRALCVDDYQRGDAVGFMHRVDREVGLDHLHRNGPMLQLRGMYEAALLEALTGCGPRVRVHSMPLVRQLIREADREQLRLAGDPLPGSGPFILYRGVSGRRSTRCVRGMAWTFSAKKAERFAEHGRQTGLADPAVYVAEVPEKRVLAYVTRRDEAVVLPWWGLRPRRIASL